MALLSVGKTDIIIYLGATMYAVNMEKDPHPYVITMKLWFMQNYLVYVCPLPKVCPILEFLVNRCFQDISEGLYC